MLHKPFTYIVLWIERWKRTDWKFAGCIFFWLRRLCSGCFPDFFLFKCGCLMASGLGLGWAVSDLLVWLTFRGKQKMFWTTVWSIPQHPADLTPQGVHTFAVVLLAHNVSNPWSTSEGLRKSWNVTQKKLYLKCIKELSLSKNPPFDRFHFSTDAVDCALPTSLADLLVHAARSPSCQTQLLSLSDGRQLACRRIYTVGWLQNVTKVVLLFILQSCVNVGQHIWASELIFSLSLLVLVPMHVSRSVDPTRLTARAQKNWLGLIRKTKTCYSVKWT